jgi:predicted DNA-binding transcriptional regulator YafY
MPQTIARRHALLGLLAEGPATADELRRRLARPCSARTIADDLRSLAQAFPEQVHRSRGGDARVVYWRLDGPPPTLLPRPIAALTHDELAALIAARGLLRAPDARTPGWERPSSAYAGDLSAALHGLLERSGLDGEARTIAPSTIGVSRFGMPTEAPGAFAAFERALRSGQAVEFRYRNRRGDERDLHVRPLRLVLIKGEWFCFAWAGKVKQYALARITSRDPSVRIVARQPPGLPTLLPHDAIDSALASGFHATGGGKRMRVVLAVSPDAWPSIADRTWGEAQQIDPQPPNLPPGWRRIAFSTTGLDECRHWVLGMGAAVRAEGPAELVEWLRGQVRGMESSLESNRTQMHAAPIAGIGVTLVDEDLGIGAPTP